MHYFNNYFNSVVNKLLCLCGNSFNSFAAKCTRAYTGHHLVDKKIQCKILILEN